MPSIAYRVPRSGGAVTPILSVDYGRGKLSAGGGVVTFGDWIVPPGEAPLVLYPGDANHQCAGAISADGDAFLGDFTTGEIYRFQP